MEPKLRKARHDNVAPLINDSCSTLILGTMLSPKSAELGFYYAHPQNRFWRVLAAVFECEPCDDTNARSELALSHGIALWDVIAACDIVGASDNTIKNVEYNDIAGLLENYPRIKRIFTTGKKAYELLEKYNRSKNNPIISEAIGLPSTSPLNCATNLDALVAAYSVIASPIDCAK